MLLPNLGFLVNKSRESSIEEPEEPLWLVIPERTGQAAVFIGPLFFRIGISDTADIIAASGMLLSLLVYYYCWIRYFRSNGKKRFLFSSLSCIPVPMAVFPVIYFFLSAVILNSWLIFVAALLLTAGHIPITYLHYRALVKGD